MTLVFCITTLKPLELLFKNNLQAIINLSDALKWNNTDSSSGNWSAGSRKSMEGGVKSSGRILYWNSAFESISVLLLNVE